MNIDDWRRRIDEIDRQLVELLNERTRCAIAIGRLKWHLGANVHQPEREREILKNALRANPGPLSDDAVRRLFERIVDEARTIEQDAYRREDSAGSKED